MKLVDQNFLEGLFIYLINHRQLSLCGLTDKFQHHPSFFQNKIKDKKKLFVFDFSWKATKDLFHYRIFGPQIELISIVLSSSNNWGFQKKRVLKNQSIKYLCFLSDLTIFNVASLV